MHPSKRTRRNRRLRTVAFWLFYLSLIGGSYLCLVEGIALIHEARVVVDGKLPADSVPMGRRGLAWITASAGAFLASELLVRIHHRKRIARIRERHERRLCSGIPGFHAAAVSSGIFQTVEW